MPLGRPIPASLEANANRRRNGESVLLRHKPSNSHQEMPPAAQFPSSAVQRDLPSLPDGAYEDARVDLAEAPIQPKKAQANSFSDDQLVTSKPHRTAATESVQYTRDVLPPRPVSPRSTPYAQKVVSATLYQSSPSSFPSVSKPYVTVTEPIATRAYGGSRQTATPSAEGIPPTDAPLSETLEPNATGSLSRFNDNLSPTGLSRPPNQASPGLEQLRSVSASPHQGAVLAPSFNGRNDGTVPFGPLSDLPSDGPGQQGRGTQRFRAQDTLPPPETPSPHGNLYRSMSPTNASEPALAPFSTPLQSPENAVITTPARRSNTQMRGRPLIFATRDQETEQGLEQTRREHIPVTRDHEFRPTTYDRGASHEVGQNVRQPPPQPQVVERPSRNGTAMDTLEHGSQFVPQRSPSHTQTYAQERTWNGQGQVGLSYGDEPPPTAHPAVRKLSKASASRTRVAGQPVPDEPRAPPAEHPRKSSHGKLLSKKSSSPRPSSAMRPEPVIAQFSPQVRQDANLPLPYSSRPLPEPNSLPPTPPEKSPPHDIRSEQSRRIESRSPPPLALADDTEIETRRDKRKSWAVRIPAAAELEEDYLQQSHAESARVDISDTPILDSPASREPPSRHSSLIGTDPIQIPEGGDQPQNDSFDNAIASSPPDLNEHLIPHNSQRPQSMFQQPSTFDGASSVVNSEVDLEPARRPRPRTLPTPPSPEEYSRARARRRGTWLEKTVPADIAELAEETIPKFYPLLDHLQNPELLTLLLLHLSFYEWLVLWGGVSRVVRQTLDSNPALCDVALERYLGTVGYTRWSWPNPEPIRISLAEMHAYMRGVSVPVHVYSQSSISILSSPPSEENALLVHAMKKETRAFNRVVIRLRTQAEADAEHSATIRRRQSIGQPQPQRQNNGPPLSWSAGAAHGQNGKHRSVSRQSSRAPSPTNSAWSHGAGSQTHLPLGNVPASAPSGFRSPLFRLRRAPLLRVFVPSPEGDWLSDAAVLECETELRKAGVPPLLRVGDVVWDTALGDEGNTGRLLWDGRYLIDLDYAYSQIGEVPPSMPALAFPPSYFHRVIRVAGDRNPIAHLDIRFWGEEIMNNLQLLSDRVRTETPQGAYHTVVRWVNRSSFTIRPPPGGTPMIILPNKERRVVDSGWRGTVVVEAEGTNEGLADLRARCRGVFQPRAGDVAPPPGERERMVWRVLRERSRPGEIWIRAVSFKERLIP